MNRRIETPQRTTAAPPTDLAEPTEGTAPVGEKKRRRRNERNAAAYDDEVCELLQAIDKWRRKSGRSFPAWSEVLQLLKELGWKKVAASAPLATALPIVEPLPPPSEPPR
ncbi:MAG: hypothetical protein JNL90_13185 [Planctomycetes bacterium]|nr:hypothetical protein [Planctomycetota bacterium]